MKITINDHRKINAIQTEFSLLFPYLTIEFFSKPPHAGAPPSEKLVNTNRTLGECRTIHRKGEITITPGMSSADLEEIFNDNFGLTVQLYRKSGKEWLAVTATDKWTLEQQNDQGKALSSLY
ncbi:MAG TPA: hypothetical protein VGO45_09460 [Bacteroidia bacterium]|jgi:hypothetical protein|nr:hypothetical protein [Bacteroidia bacterium]